MAGSARAAERLRSVSDAFRHVLRERVATGDIIANQRELLDYLRLTLGHAPREQMRVLFLNARHELLADECVARGSVTEAHVYPREVLRRAFELGATGLILVHNHPSGDPTPSASDRDLTDRLAAAGQHVDIRVHDHIVVARDGWTSLREEGLVQEGLV